ncbi:MAG: hypothetical protein K2W85_17395 [Phycisphaerales bacterium]|nr:hypothetical protein [Phycisphaerales bacterium]
MPDAARVAKIARQHAQTEKLMGVECVPMRAANAVVVPPTPEAEVTARPARETPAPTRPKPTPSTPAHAPTKVSASTPAPTPVQPRPQPATVIEPKPVVQHTDPARQAAQRTLDLIRARYERDAPHTKFVTEFTHIVFGEGDPRARLMFVGEAPGADEDKCGRPFVGRAGQLLDKMIIALGLKREDVYIANVLKTRPPNNATPTSDECALCSPYLYQQIAAVRPEVIVTLGLPATRTLLNTTEPMARLRGQWASFQPPELWEGQAPPGEGPIPVVPTYHPAFLLRAYTRENRQKVWSDLLMAAQKLGLQVPTNRSES